MTTLAKPVADSFTRARWLDPIDDDSMPAPVFEEVLARSTTEAGKDLQYWSSNSSSTQISLLSDATSLLSLMWEGVSTHPEPEGFFNLALSEYVSARGSAQKKQRQQLLSWIETSTSQDQKIAQVLEEVAKLRTQEVMEAAIDLLAPLGNVIVARAYHMALKPTLDNENAAFVLASAAGRAAENTLDVLLCSKHDAIREAAVELAANLPSARGKPVLRRIAAEDKSPALRARAEELLEDFS